MADVGRKAAPSSRSAGTALGAPRRWGSPVSPGLCGDQEGGLPCKGVAGQPLRRSQEGTRELGSGAKPWSQGDRARTGLALLGHTWDTHHLCHTDLQRMSWQGQGARVGQEWLDKERRKTATSQEEKLELLERLRELERGRRSLLRQRLQVLQRLQGLLRRDTADTLRQLREALEQEGEQRQQPEKTPAPGAPREPPVQSQREHPQPASIPGLAQPGRGSRGLLQHFQELQLEQAPNTGSPNALGAQLGTGDREGQPGVGAVPQPRC